MFPDLDEYQFAKVFVVGKHKQIAQDLEIKYLDEDITAKTIGSFIEQNQGELLKKFDDKPKWMVSAGFYDEIINALRTAQEQGTALGMTAEQYIEYLRDKLRKHTFVE